MHINQDNYILIEGFLPDDNEITEWFGLIKELIESPHINLPENESSRTEITEFFKQLNTWLEDGVIDIPANIQERILEQNIATPPDQPNGTAHSKRLDAPVMPGNLSINDINPLISDVNKHSLLTEQKQVETIVPDNLRNYQAPLNNISKKPATSRLTYTLGENDHKIISDLELPKKKQYILQEIRVRFGNPVDKEKFGSYGKNRFARSLEQLYPTGFKISEIKMVVTRIMDYEQLLKNLRPVG